MAFNYEQTFKGMVAAATGALNTETPRVQDYVQKVLEDHKDDLEKLVKQRLDPNSKLSQEDFLSELEDEKSTLSSELGGAEEIAAKVAEDAANAAIDVLITAVTKAVGL